MKKWIIPANPNVYDAEASFEKNGFIDWTQNNYKYEIGDIVYLYCSQTIRKVMFKAIVEKVNILPSEVTLDEEFWIDLDAYNEAKERTYFRIRLLDKVDKEELSLDNLKQNGLKAAPQGPQKVNDELAQYMDKYFKVDSDSYNTNLFEFNDLIKDDYNIWSMNISSKESYDVAWNMFKQHSCASIDYWVTNKNVDYGEFNSKNKIQEFLNADENSLQPALINTFVNQIEIGDIFLIHKGENLLTAIGIITSDYIYQNESLKHIRKVKWFYQADDLKIPKKSRFARYGIINLKEDPKFFNRLLTIIASKDESVKDNLLEFLYREFYNKYHSQEKGKSHTQGYVEEELYIKEKWELIRQKDLHNENFADNIWVDIFQRKLGVLRVGARNMRNQVQQQSKRSFGEEGLSDEDMDNIAINFFRVINKILETDDIDEQRRILKEYHGSPCSYGFKTGRFSPVLFYLNDSFYPINSKTVKTVNFFSNILGDEIKLSQDLDEYIDNNLVYKDFLGKLYDAYHFEEFDIGDVRIFDEICHWICAVDEYIDKIMLPINILINDSKEVNYHPIEYVKPFESDEKRNLIYFGAPGTGKSYNLNQDKDKLLENYENNYERVTFHPNYSYANFVGTYKPVPEGKDITYRYVPGPFMRILKKAIEKPSQPFLLVIEEINRANVAAVFGDVFQLLDRNEENVSEYDIATSEDMKTYLNKERIFLPSNLFIWATMNSADQGVFPMDTAFKRRWDFKYFSINHNEKLIENTKTNINDEEVNWNKLRKQINDELLSYKINEDKLMGPFFAFNEFMGQEIPTETFKDIFKNKIIMYLFEDAARARRNDLFSGARTKDYVTYSEICEEFDRNGLKIFKFISDDE